MSPRSVDRESPDRLYTVTGGRTLGDDDPFDLVSLIVSEREPAPGMQSEHVKILRDCQSPMAVVEISSELGMPVSVVKILLRDLLDTGSITVRRPAGAATRPRHAEAGARWAPETLIRPVWRPAARCGRRPARG